MPPSKPITILIVDDDDKVRRALEMILDHSGYRVIPAKTGREGVELAGSMNPDLILMDVLMPEIDGLEAISRIRQLPRGDQIPIMLLSVLGQEAEAQEKGRALGLCDCLVKPIMIDDLRERIEACLRDTP